MHEVQLHALRPPPVTDAFEVLVPRAPPMPDFRDSRARMFEMRIALLAALASVAVALGVSVVGLF